MVESKLIETGMSDELAEMIGTAEFTECDIRRESLGAALQFHSMPSMRPTGDDAPPTGYDVVATAEIFADFLRGPKLAQAPDDIEF